MKQYIYKLSIIILKFIVEQFAKILTNIFYEIEHLKIE